MGEHLYTYINPVNEKHISEILSLLSSGGVIALPMGTSWAFCCDASSNKALEMLLLAIKTAGTAHGKMKNVQKRKFRLLGKRKNV